MDLPLKLPRFETRTGPDGTEWRIVVMGNPVNTLLLGADMTTFHLRMLELRRNYLVTVVIGLLFVAGCAWLLAGRALSPVRQLSDALRNVNSRGLGQRLNPSGFDRDFMEMIDVFNGMMNRLESSFHQATRFSADASHELKTPLAILQGEIETALQHAADGSDDQRRWSELLGEIQRLKSIVQKLLLLSQADTGELKLDRTEVVLSEVVENHVEDLGILAEGLEVESEIQPGIVAPVDQTLIQQVIQNLLSNAVKYNREGGRVRVELKQAEGSRPVLSVGNTGDPIPESSRDRVFDRFFRADASRSRVVEGTGLGLSLSLEIVKAHGGELKLAYSESDWTEFQVVF